MRGRRLPRIDDGDARRGLHGNVHAVRGRVLRAGVRCGGCGAKFVDAAGFQAHCAEVEHDDDFCYECDDIFEAVYDDDDDAGAA